MQAVNRQQPMQAWQQAMHQHQNAGRDKGSHCYTRMHDGESPGGWGSLGSPKTGVTRIPLDRNKNRCALARPGLGRACMSHLRWIATRKNVHTTYANIVSHQTRMCHARQRR